MFYFLFKDASEHLHSKNFIYELIYIVTCAMKS